MYIQSTYIYCNTGTMGVILGISILLIRKGLKSLWMFIHRGPCNTYIGKEYTVDSVFSGHSRDLRMLFWPLKTEVRLRQSSLKTESTVLQTQHIRLLQI